MDLKLRQTYLGGTDLVAISGISPWRKPGDVWLEKARGVIGFEGNAATELGTDLEDVIAMRHARRMRKAGEVVELGTIPDPVYHPVYPFIAANPDRIYLNRRRVLECKSADEGQLYDASYGWGENMETGKVPPYYLGQTNHYVGILGYDDGILSALFLGRSREQRDYPIPFDKDLFDLLVANGVAFWEKYIATRTQPPVELFSPEVVMKAISLRAHAHGGKAGVLVQPDSLLEKWAEEYKDLSERMNVLEGPKKMLAGKIAQWISSKSGTKVIHSMGSFTYQKPEDKPAVKVFDAESAWKSLRALIEKLPPSVVDQVLALTAEIQAKFTTEEVPEARTPSLHTFWKK